MDKNPFLKRLIKDNREDIVHTSAYAKAQNAEGMGVASTQGFGDRMRVEQNWTVVGRYRDSKVVNEVGDGTIKAKRYDQSEDAAKMVAQRKSYAEKQAERQFGGGESGTVRTRFSGGTTSEDKKPTPPARKNPGIYR